METCLIICMYPASITHTVTLNYSRLSVAHDLFEGMVCYLGNYAQLLNSCVDERAGCLSDCQFELHLDECTQQIVLS